MKLTIRIGKKYKAPLPVEANYDAGLEKINDKWLISKYKINIIRQSGDTTLPSKALEKGRIKNEMK
jgi:hypothetical protein